MFILKTIFVFFRFYELFIFVTTKVLLSTYVDAAYCYRPSRVVWSVLSDGRSVTVVSPAKTAEPIEMQFSSRTRVGPKNHVLAEVHTGVTWRIPMYHSCAAAMRHYFDHLFHFMFTRRQRPQMYETLASPI